MEKTNTPTPVIMSCGGKGAGKSTFSRYLVNRLLSSPRRCPLAYIETDVGQSEFTPSGIVSLHIMSPTVGSSYLLGPASTHLREPLLSFYVGDVTPKTRPSLYMAMIRKLLDEYQQIAPDYIEFGGMPLIVNTHGWVQGMGLDLIHAVASYARPTDIIKFESSNPRKQFTTPMGVTESPEQRKTPPPPTIHIVTPFEEICSDVSVSSSSSPSSLSSSSFRPSRPTASAQRTMRMVQYFVRNRLSHGSGKEEVAEESEEEKEEKSIDAHRSLSYNADVLASELPYRIGFHKMYVHAVHASTLPDEEVLATINGSIVGLCCVDELTVAAATTVTATARPRMLRGATPIAPCRGLGIVRSIDSHKRLLYVITPIPLASLRDVNLLMRGNIQLPSELLLSRNFSETPPYHCAPHQTISGTGAGANSMNVGIGHQKEVKRRRLDR
jgi:polynucleotide 5'-hydroxyl-kinase GRC3/NOL9